MSEIKNNMEIFTSAEIEGKIQLIKQELNTLHNEFLHTEVKNIAVGFAQNNYPKIDDGIAAYIGKIKAYYQKLRSEVPLRIAGQLQLLTGAMEIQTVDEHIKKAEEEKRALEKEKWYLENTFKKASIPINLESYKWKKYSLWLIGFVEVMGYIACFVSVLSDSIFSAIILGTTIGVCVLFLLKSVVIDYRDNEVKSKKRFYAIGALLLVLAVSLGGLRYAGVLTNDPSTQASIFNNPIVFIAINLLIMCATGYFMYIFHPSQAELKYVDDYKKMKDDLDKKIAEIKATDAEIEHHKESKNSIMRYRIQMRHYQAVLFERIEAMYMESASYFIETNLKARRDGIFPNCFNEPIPPLDTNNADENISNFLNQ
ncbi:MAG: hypothetical protein K1X55_10310 [Chitinophagales bacterium]|nr:hypothetical protein [Chitinophagales bacterium]